MQESFQSVCVTERIHRTGKKFFRLLGRQIPYIVFSFRLLYGFMFVLLLRSGCRSGNRTPIPVAIGPAQIASANQIHAFTSCCVASTRPKTFDIGNDRRLFRPFTIPSTNRKRSEGATISRSRKSYTAAYTIRYGSCTCTVRYRSESLQAKRAGRMNRAWEMTSHCSRGYRI